MIGLSLLISSLAVLLFLAAVRQLSAAAIQRTAGIVLNVRAQNIEPIMELEINAETFAKIVELYTTTKIMSHEDLSIMDSE